MKNPSKPTQTAELPLATEYRILLNLQIATMKADIAFMEQELAKLDAQQKGTK